MDKIYFNGMRFYGYHGVYPEENRLGQRFHVDLQLYLDLSLPGKTDDLHDTVNYADAYQIAKRIVEEERYRLIETVAEKIAARLLESFDLVKQVMVRVTKPDPPIPGHYDSVAVEIIRKKV